MKYLNVKQSLRIQNFVEKADGTILFAPSLGVAIRSLSLRLEVTEISLHTTKPHFRLGWLQKELLDGE